MSHHTTHLMNKIRTLLALACTLLMAAHVSAADTDLYSIPLKDIDGKDTTLKTYAGKALLIVNVASKCGYTRQYSGLEELWKKYQDKGLVVLGFPSNDFGGQEPGTNEEIKQFCSSKFAVSFPLFDKLHTKGPEQSPLYAALTASNGPVKWNFNKFLIGRDGKIIAHFDSKVEPNSPELATAIDAALAAK